MNLEAFSDFIETAPWRFAKSVPNWPHFYIVEQELADQESYRKARSFIQESGRDGNFFDFKVRYYDLNDWTYWASPLKESITQKYMLNRCKSEHTYDAQIAKGQIPCFDCDEGLMKRTFIAYEFTDSQGKTGNIDRVPAFKCTNCNSSVIGDEGMKFVDRELEKLNVIPERRRR